MLDGWFAFHLYVQTLVCNKVTLDSQRTRSHDAHTRVPNPFADTAFRMANRFSIKLPIIRVEIVTDSDLRKKTVKRRDLHFNIDCGVLCGGLMN